MGRLIGSGGRIFPSASLLLIPQSLSSLCQRLFMRRPRSHLSGALPPEHGHVNNARGCVYFPA